MALDPDYRHLEPGTPQWERARAALARRVGSLDGWQYMGQSGIYPGSHVFRLRAGVAAQAGCGFNRYEHVAGEPPTWHVVTSQGRVILGVFGAALLSHAQECARKVTAQTGFPAFVAQVTGDRPTVGGAL